MSKFRVEKYTNDGNEIDVKVDYDNKEIWLTQRDIANLYSVSVPNVNLHLKNILKNDDSFSSTIKSDLIIEKEFLTMSSNGKTYRVKHYNMDIIMRVGYKCNPGKAVEFKEWVNSLFNDNTTDNNWLNRADNCEIVKFESDGITLDVNVSPNEDTVWLNINDLAKLYDTFKQNISYHIGNIFDDEELEKNSVVKEILTTARDGKTYNVTYYNLDMVLTIGYRINSKRGIEFRKWANKVLKNYLLKGYSINIDIFNINHKLNIVKTNIIHSRFIIVDDTIYQISESIKDVGVKRFVSTLINFVSVDELLKGL